MFKTITTFVASFALLAVGSVSAQSHVDFRDTLRMTFPATVSVSGIGHDNHADQFGQLRQFNRMGGLFGGAGINLNVPMVGSAPINAGFAISADKIITQLKGSGDEVVVTTFDKTEHIGKVIARDNVTGLCVVKVDDAQLVSLVIGDGNPEPGLPVVTTWLANGVGTSKSGMIASAPNSGQPRLGFTQQIDNGDRMTATGAPVVDAQGTLVGITVAGENGGVVCMPVEQLTRLIDLGLGDQPTNLNRGIVGIQFNSESGSSVDAVSPGSAGEKAGLAVGDKISQINNYRIHSYKDVIAAVAMARAGDSLQITFERGDETMERTVVLGDHPEQRITLSPLPGGNRALPDVQGQALQPLGKGGQQFEFGPNGRGFFQQQGWVLKDGKLVPMDLENNDAMDALGMREQMERMLQGFNFPGRIDGLQIERSEGEKARRDLEAEQQRLQKENDELKEKLRALEGSETDDV